MVTVYYNIINWIDDDIVSKLAPVGVRLPHPKPTSTPIEITQPIYI
jgi:hypothetical protein